MKISLEWVREYTPLPPELSAQEIADRLTIATVEVERVIDLSRDLEGVIVGLITEVTPHPNSDRLNLVTVNLGERGEQRVVCGGSNVAVDMSIAFALEGAEVYGRDGERFRLGQVTIRGVESAGMICAGQELGLNLLLPASGKEISDLTEWGGAPGQALAELIGYHDFVLDIDNKSLTNRPDLWGHYGIARELASLYQLELKPLESVTELPEDDGAITVEISDPASCPRYTCTVIEGVDTRPAPTWMRARLAKVEQKPINLLVDLTNYVMMALGQPSHAFDRRDITAGLQIRDAVAGEEITLLDETELKLRDDDLVIASGAPVALAGVMGGERGVRDDTSALVLEVASFDASGIRRTTRRYQTRSESSARFDKGIDVARVDTALALLLRELKRAIPSVRVVSSRDVYPHPVASTQVELKLSFLQRKLGFEVSAAEVASLISPLGFAVHADEITDVQSGVESDIALKIDVPSWRATGDISLPADIVEEVGRMYGYDRLSFIAPQVHLTGAVIQPRRRLERRLKEHLARQEGMFEVVTYPWVHEQSLEILGFAELPRIELATPHAPELKWIRPALIPGMIDVINQNHHNVTSFSTFELGRVFLASEAEPDPKTGERLPHQPRHLSGACVGRDAAALFLQAKGVLERLARAAQCTPITLKPSPEARPAWADRVGHLAIYAGEYKIGDLGVLSVRCKHHLGLKQGEVVLFELEVDALEPYASRENTYRALPRYPEVEFDLAFIVPLTVAWRDVEREVNAVDDRIRRVQFIEDFVGEQIPEGHKSMMIRAHFGSSEGTLSREAINEISQAMIKRLESSLGAQLR